MDRMNDRWLYADFMEESTMICTKFMLPMMLLGIVNNEGYFMLSLFFTLDQRISATKVLDMVVKLLFTWSKSHNHVHFLALLIWIPFDYKAWVVKRMINQQSHNDKNSLMYSKSNMNSYHLIWSIQSVLMLHWKHPQGCKQFYYLFLFYSVEHAYTYN